MATEDEKGRMIHRLIDLQNQRNRNFPLEQRARDLLAQASVLSEVTGRRLDGDRTSHGKIEGTMPTGANLSVYDRLARRFAKGVDENAITWAEREIELVTKSRPKPKVKFKDRIVYEWEGHHYRAVARTTNTPATTIRRWRELAGRDPLYGREDRAA